MPVILKDAGRFEIITPATPAEGRRQLRIIEKLGRICYQSETGKITTGTAKKFVWKRMHQGHETVIEHVYMTVIFNGCSRGFTHELVRHRLASYSQESTRWVDYAKGSDAIDLGNIQIKFVVPPHRDEHAPVDLGDGRSMTPVEMVSEVEKYYLALRRDRWFPQDARQILPTGLVAEIAATANLREWRHIIKLRTGKNAHWEIRKVTGDLLIAIQGIIPVIFDDFVEAGVDRNGLRYFNQDPSVFKRED